MNTYYIHADRFFLPTGTELDGYLKIEDGKFGSYSKEKPDGKILDYTGYWISPGLVDSHVHGYMGYDVMDNDVDGLNRMSEGLLSAGVTSFLPTTLTAPADLLSDVCKNISEHHLELKGAKVKGIYFEGPFFTEKHKGAQNPAYFLNPTMDVFNKWQESAQGMLTKIGLAPERENADTFIREVTETGVVVALGHSGCTFDEAKRCVQAGATMYVHTFNGMTGLSHREPGLVGAAMTMEDTIGELICDGHHVHPAAAKALIDVKTPDKIALITDCMRAGGMPEGEYILGEFPVIVKDGKAVLKNGGSLAGSILRLVDGVKNVVDWGIASPSEAIHMGTYVPAKSLNIEDTCGRIKQGMDADFIVLNPDLTLVETYLDGVSRYKK